MKFSAGYARREITPALGTYINGYFKERYAEGVLDPLELCCLALSLGEKKVVLCTVDNLGVPRRVLEPMLQRAAEATGLPKEAFYFSATHSHSGIDTLGSQRGCTMITCKPDTSFAIEKFNYYSDRYDLEGFEREEVTMQYENVTIRPVTE
jgi:hypothetical protein